MRIKPRPANPIIPGNTADRTGTAGILRRARAEVNRRYAGLQAEALAIFARIRVYEVNEGPLVAAPAPAPKPAPRTVYALTPDEMAQVAADLQAALDRWLIEGREAKNIAWWNRYAAEAQQLGTAQSVANLKRLSASYAAARTLEQVVFSEPYARRAAAARFKSYEHWTGLAAEARSDLAQIIGRAVVDGKNPRAVRAEIMERLGVSKSRAMGYAQTDITDALRQARADEADAAQAQFGFAVGLLWTSALLPTTRATHAARNGKVYTSNEVRAFYSINGNRYRCHCAQVECLLDEEGDPILSEAAQASFARELKAWEKARK